MLNRDSIRFVLACVCVEIRDAEKLFRSPSHIAPMKLFEDMDRACITVRQYFLTNLTDRIKYVAMT